MAVQNITLLQGLVGFIGWLENHQIDKNKIVVRFPTQEDGLKFLYYVEKEFPLTVGTLKPEISWVEVGGIRFIWPMKVDYK